MKPTPESFGAFPFRCPFRFSRLDEAALSRTGLAMSQHVNACQCGFPTVAVELRDDGRGFESDCCPHQIAIITLHPRETSCRACLIVFTRSRAQAWSAKLVNQTGRALEQ